RLPRLPFAFVPLDRLGVDQPPKRRALHAEPPAVTELAHPLGREAEPERRVLRGDPSRRPHPPPPVRLCLPTGMPKVKRRRGCRGRSPRPAAARRRSRAPSEPAVG